MITINPPIEELSLHQRMELIQQLEATLPADYIADDWEQEELASREQQMKSGEDQLLDLAEFASEVKADCRR